MKLAFEKYKGIHPGLILEHELKKRGISKRQFAASVEEHPQTFSAITKGKRKLTPALSFKIDKALEVAQGTMLFMQAYYEMAEYNRQTEPNISSSIKTKIRPGLFWDTDFQSIDWKSQANAIIRRVYDRGNDYEKQVVSEHYGHKLVQ